MPISELPVSVGGRDFMRSALRYFHAVGDLVLIREGAAEGWVCPRPAETSKLLARFVSPENVQGQLPHLARGNVAILSSTQVGKVLLIGEQSSRR